MRVLRTKVRRDIRRQRAQFAAIAITIFLGVTLFGASYDAYRNLDTSYRHAFTEYRFANLTVSGGNVRRVVHEAERTPGVEAVQTRVEADVPIRVGQTKFLGRVVGMPPDHQPAVNMVEIERGRYLEAGSRNGVLVEEHMADHFDLRPGDRLRVVGASGPRGLRVLGVAASPEYFWPARSRQDLLPSPDDFGVIFAPEGLAEELAGLRGPNQVAIHYRGGAASGRLTARLTGVAEEAGASGVLTRADQPSNSALQQDVKGFRELALLFPLLFLTAAALATGILLRRLVVAQRPIVGMLRACGFSRGEVVRHYLSFGLAAGLAGGVPGAAAGVALAGLVTHAYTTALSIPVTLVQVSPLTVLVGLAFGLGVGALAAALPARAASRVPPAEAMRSLSPPRSGHVSLIERAAPPLRRLPARWRMVLRSIGRNRRRSLSTVVGVVLALTLVLVSWGMIDTTQILVERQFDQVERQDGELYFRHPVSPRRLTQVRSTSGVERAEPGLNIPVSLAANGRRYQTALIGLEPDTRMHGFLLDGGGEASLPPNGLLAGKALRSELDIEGGDDVRVSIPGMDLEAQAPVEDFVDEPLGTYAYASLDAIRGVADRRLGEGNVVLVRYPAGVDREQMRRRLSELPGVVAFEDSNALRDTVNSYLGLYYAFVGAMLLFGSAMAFALLYNGIQSNLAERSVEVATLRAAGTPFGTLSRMITGENVLLTALGIAPGLLVGYEVARLFMASFSSDQFSFELQMRTSTLVLSSLAVVAVALLSQIPGLRAVKRLDVAGVVRERSA